MMLNDHAIRLANLSFLMERTAGLSNLRIGMVDGPVDLRHPLLSPSIEVLGEGSKGCTRFESEACRHGTFVAGILASRRDVQPSGLCPDCPLIVRPVFQEDQHAKSTTGEVAAAIQELVLGGVRVINLSAAPASTTISGDRELNTVLDHAAKEGVLIVAAAGNLGGVSGWSLTRHSGVISVSACDSMGRLLPTSNLSLAGARRGILAPGQNIASLAPDGRTTTLTGTSAATPFVVATIALLWSLFPQATATEIRAALIQKQRGSLIPSLLDGDRALNALQQRVSLNRSIVMNPSENASLSSPEKSFTDKSTVVPQCESGCGCKGGCGGESATTPNYIYAIGQVEPRFPSLGIEKEFAQATARQDTGDLTDRATMVAVLSKPENRYLLRKLCWVFTIEGLQTYLLELRHSADLDRLLEALRPNPKRMDVDVVIGTRGRIAPPNYCNGLGLPLITVDQLYSFDIDGLIKSIPKPNDVPKDKFEAIGEEVFARVSQIADNAGASDEHRALNYLLVRYPTVYARTADAHHRNFALTSIDVRPSRLAGVRRVVDVVITYTHRQTDVMEKVFVRVDVTEQFPFLVSKLAPYFDR